ncbi:MAG: hypothetical protein JW878_02320 [Methanomicrobia archaeon]|nr:hypothetical protein [Methanomicrobia archaeon]
MPDGNEPPSGGHPEKKQVDVNALIGEENDPKKVWDEIKKAISNLLCLEITTRLCGGAEDEKIYTKIDLLQADRTNEIHRIFLTDPDLAFLLEFHTDQVELAEQDIQTKLEFLRNLAKTLSAEIKEAT